MTAGGEELVFTDVYCKVSDGQLRHLIAKTNNGLPLLEVTPGEFAMLKVGQRGAPEKNTAPTSIDYFPEGVVFDSAPIGSVTVDGSLGCTQIDGE